MGPLAGTRVLDVSGRTGAYCGKILADLGADVIKVELPAGDRMRFVPPFRDGHSGPEGSLLFAVLPPQQARHHPRLAAGGRTPPARESGGDDGRGRRLAQG